MRYRCFASFWSAEGVPISICWRQANTTTMPLYGRQWWMTSSIYRMAHSQIPDIRTSITLRRIFAGIKPRRHDFMACLQGGEHYQIASDNVVSSVISVDKPPDADEKASGIPKRAHGKVNFMTSKIFINSCFVAEYAGVLFWAWWHERASMPNFDS